MSAQVLSFSAIVLTLGWVAEVAGQPGGQTEAPKTDVTQPKPAPPTTRGPKYLDLRYDEDFRYLEGEPGTFQPDFFDPVKDIRLGEDWRLTVGGEFRFRMEAETNRAFGATEPTQDTFALYRFLLHSDLKYRDLFRVFAQGIEAFDDDRDLAQRPFDENEWDIHQLFFDLRFLGEEQPWTVRAGRQELSYGNERLISPADWANVRRRFDGVKVFARTERWDVDFWAVRPVAVQPEQNDHSDEDVDFYGAYTTYKGWPRHVLDLYALALDDSANRRNPNGNAGDRNIYTLGTRFRGETSDVDYETELAGQWGHWAGDTVQAWSWTLDGGYTFAQAPGKPRLGAGFDWATGDDSPTDGRVGTFDQLFPLGHKYFGYLDLVGRQNITAVNVNAAAWPVADKVRAALFYHMFWLSEDRDALYDASGAPTRRDPTGQSGREVGNELDATITWKLDVHSSLLFGYSHFWDGGFLQDSGPSENVDLFYIQYAFKF